MLECCAQTMAHGYTGSSKAQVVNKQRQVLHDIVRTLTGQEREAVGLGQVGFVFGSPTALSQVGI